MIPRNFKARLWRAFFMGAFMGAPEQKLAVRLQ
jgi:hypothetical protein